MARNRLLTLAGLAALAAVIVVLVVVLAGGSEDEPAKRSGGGGSASAPADVLEGIPQKGAVLGKADAPYTMVEFVDPQCPFCAEYATGAFPTVVERYVKPGKLRVEQRLLHFLGPDSTKIATTAAAASTHDRMFEFMESAFENQGGENSGYATDAWLSARLRDAGLDPADVLREAKQRKGARLLAESERAARSGGIDSTPGFLLGRTGGTLEQFSPDDLTAEAFTGPLDELTGGG